MAAPLLAAGVAAAAYGLLIALRSVRTHNGDTPPPGRPFNPRLALLFAATMGVLLLLTAFLTDRYGTGGAGIAAALAGFADAHSASAAVASLQASGRMTADQAVLPVLAAFTTNACSKLIVATTTGDRAFALQVVPGVLLSVGAAWLTMLI
jgi:uncharacterized membrane protein (DUF4010 family)